MPRRHLIFDVLCIVALCTALPQPAYAYLDASTMAIVGQVIAGGIMGFLLFFRRIVAGLKSIGLVLKKAPPADPNPSPPSAEKLDG